VFARLPASVVVDQLCVVLADGGYGDPPPEIEKSSDPFDVLKYVATLGKAEAEYVNTALTALEVEAIVTAEPTPGAHDLIRARSQAARPVTIVSNNSKTAIRAYFDLHGLREHVAYISGRTSHDPALLKPNVYLLTKL
jgi:phosphoglycolate phosphatase